MTLKLPRNILLLIMVTTLALLNGCASSPPVPEVDFKASHDFSVIKTLSFTKATTSGGSTRVFLSDMQINRIDDALARALESKGFKIVLDASAADAIVHWHLAAHDKTSIQTHTTPGAYGGYGRYNRAALYNCWNCGSNTVVDVREYTEGTFIVDIIDPALKQSVWRSVTQSRLKGKAMKDRAALDAAATAILADFPPGSGVPTK